MDDPTTTHPDPNRDDVHEGETATDVQDADVKDLENDPAYEPDDEALKNIKGG